MIGLGVGIDYAEHYFTHYVLDAHGGDRKSVRVMRAIWPGLWMGAATTIAGFAGLGWADFPGAIEMAVFARGTDDGLWMKYFNKK
mgnify:CR=1 FL=1